MWVKGQSGNPKGRKRNAHTLTDALRDAVSKPGVRKQIIAMLMEEATRNTTKLSSADWLRLLQWIFTRLEGDMPVEVSLPPVFVEVQRANE